MNLPIAQAIQQFTACCVDEQRYRVAWLTGEPMTGKTTLAKELCERQGWQYLDYTLEPGYFDALKGKIVTYDPEHLRSDVISWSAACPAPVLVIDEIDAVLSVWSHDQRRAWANQASRLTYLRCGVIIVTHLLDCVTLSSFLVDRGQRYCLSLSGETA